ncbi:hypothetical protein WICPIJ_001074 [Wickerhamomyces pijperi]|uniref:F-box/LRR-repeat protein 15-like leucin rich repeat domain-containing protein n=1 Tax=Wickerhamomyces pijperi TaxID=599730 RepID=A0A9P8TQ83_WICPI|nr:hypothetical protein WICPIJ_001074 [Wickerhamomyces pijperi]
MDISVPSIGHHIEELDLSNCKKVRDDVIERIIGWRKNRHQQQHQYTMHAHLDLEPVPGMEDFDQSRNSLTTKPTAGCQNIKRLNLGYCKHLTDRTMYHIAMHASDTLESLDLTRCISITDVGFAYWAYQPFPRLTRLKLSDCTFLTDKTIIAVASTACNLQVLDLSFCCALTDVSVEVLCLGCPQLRSLDLSFCGSAVSDSTLLALSIHLRNLEKLVIKGCIRVTRAGIDALLSSSKALKHLDVSQCRNAHVYRNNVPAARILPARGSKSAFVRNTLGNVVEIVI